jgi:hypothetical protein
MTSAAPVAVSEQEAHDWLLHVIPLPKEVKIESRITVPVSGISLMVQKDPDALYARELEQIAQELKARGQETMPMPSEADILIIVGEIDLQGKVHGREVAEADRLADLNNWEQAYTIRATDGKTLLIAGHEPEGVYYGVKTLWQLIEPTLREVDGQWLADIPLCEIVDWPDLAERGEWGGSVNRDIEWMAERKMNLCESHCKGLKVTSEGKGVAEFDKSLIERGAKCAVKVVPIITHLDQLARTGLFKVFPNTLGVGDPKTWPYGGTSVKPACFSKPETARVLADWMVSLAEQPEITDINVWLSEHHVACGCEQCKQKGQFALEAEAIARGYELAREARPDIKLRVLLTQGSYKFNDQVIAALPREIGITYYDGGKTYDSSRNPMIYPLLEEYAKDGGWLGCYPQLDPSWRIVCPWSGPQFIKFRMTEFVDDGLECLCGYATPDNRYWDFNVNAAAEWSWNAHGRDEREFALAYFTKKGVSDPAKAADWAVMLGPVGWDVYGARVPFSWFFGRIGQSLKQGNLPKLGSGPFVYMPDEEHIEKDLQVCATAMVLAREVGNRALIAETQVIEGYVRMLKAIHKLGEAIGKKKELTDEEKQTVGGLMGELDRATHQTTEGLKAWGQAVAPDSTAGRFDDTVRVTEETCAAIGEVLAPLGVEDPGRPYRLKQAGQWKTEDFKAGPRITKQWDVTKHLAGPGKLTPVVKDEHEGTAAHRNKANTYELALTEYDPELLYFLVADIRGMPKDSPPDKQGCEGEVWMWKVRGQED